MQEKKTKSHAHLLYILLQVYRYTWYQAPTPPEAQALTYRENHTGWDPSASIECKALSKGAWLGAYIPGIFSSHEAVRSVGVGHAPQEQQRKDRVSHAQHAAQRHGTHQETPPLDALLRGVRKTALLAVWVATTGSQTGFVVVYEFTTACVPLLLVRIYESSLGEG